MENKERKKINPDLVLLAIIAAVVLVLFLCFRFVTGFLIKSIDADDVQSITLDSASGVSPDIYHIQLDENEIKEFARVYNFSNYNGKERNFDTSSLYSFTIDFKDGTSMHVSEYGYLFTVSLWEDGEYTGSGFHVTNKKIDTFVEELREAHNQ